MSRLPLVAYIVHFAYHDSHPVFLGRWSIQTTHAGEHARGRDRDIRSERRNSPLKVTRTLGSKGFASASVRSLRAQAAARHSS